MKLRVSLAIALLLSLAAALFAQSAGRAAQSRKPGAGDRIEFQMFPVRNTGIRFPRLISYSDAKIMKEVNRQIDELTGEFGCDDAEPGKKFSFDVKSRVEYAEKQLFSIYVSESFDCGAAHPTNDYNNSLTFDLKTGKLVEFEEMFKDYEADRQEILRTIFAKQVEQSEKLAASGKRREASCEGDPELYSMEHLEGSTFAFNLSREGLRVQPDWPHVIAACAERVTVPYEKLRKFAAPGGVLLRVMQ
ncbi:MAG TPA: hypothetical protein VFD58_24885 [Blastocatellia bacterium]|nr:hypothetical protein [Blastocatellia bacterium]